VEANGDRQAMAANNTTDSASPVDDADRTRRIREFIEDMEWPSDDELEYISDHSGLSMM
jgi:hypothetical protein